MTYPLTKRVQSHIESVIVPPLAHIYRRMLGNTRFIAVTGSCGKTTTKELIADILAQRESTHRSFDSNNRYFSVARTLLELRSAHRNCVFELGASGPGSLDRSIALLRPHVAVVLTVGTDHFKAFRGADAVAAEKRKLVAALDTGGIAVLNSDDAAVMAMAEGCRGQVLTFGFADRADVRGEIVSWRWPERLSLRVEHGDEQVVVKSQLLGAHSATPLLAAIATAVACGMRVADTVPAVERASPIFGRMYAEAARGHVTFIHDHFKAPLWTMETVVRFLGEARAERRILLFGTLSDYGGSAYRRHVQLAKSALDQVEHVVFCSRYAQSHLRKLRTRYAGRLHVFSDVQHAAAFMKTFVRRGDLVLLKGSHRADHLERIVLQYQSSVNCWRNACGREVFCQHCDLRSTSASGDT